ncbi:MAG: hypothetical protein M1827_006047 [Pycnora praestabilis]|nr:MAG: hypothetical protein M1827_006047 [Pycnora praestabilis]
MSSSQTQVLQNLRKYAHDVQNAQKEGLDIDEGIATASQNAYEARLDRTVRELQERVKQQELALEKLRAVASAPSASEPSADPIERLQQLRAIKAGYDSLTSAEPSYPTPDLPLPALLALRDYQHLITETRISVININDKLTKARERVEKEETDLRDARSITSALESRIERLRVEAQEQSKKSPTQVAKEMVREQQKRKANYEQETKRLVKAFNAFIDDPLAGMLAAEELGGPVVGDMLDVEEDTLGAGFSAQGRPKRRKSSMQVEDPKRQQRIDQIWGRKEASEGDEAGLERSEKEAAGAEMRALTEELLNASASGSTTGPYVTLRRDSAAARFLVRARAAQFHPKDARRLRLVAFGWELDD